MPDYLYGPVDSDNIAGDAVDTDQIADQAIDPTKVANLGSSLGGLAVVFSKSFATGGTYIHNSDAPFKYRVIDAWVIGQGGTTPTWKLTDGTNDITTSISFSTGGVSRAQAIDTSFYDIDEGGTLRLTVGGTTPSGVIVVMALRIA